MKKQFLLTKTLLVALLCLVGQSVWGAVGDKTTNLDIDFSSAISDGKVTGTTGFITISAAEIADGILRVGNGTNSASLTGSAAGSGDQVQVTFDLAFGKLINKNVWFRLKDSSGNVIGEFSFCPYSGTISTNTFGIATDDLYYASNTVIWDRKVSFTITLNYKNRKITTATTCLKSGTGKAATNAEHTVDMTNSNPLAVFEIGSNYNNADRRCSFDNLKVVTTEGESVTATSYTINYKLGENVVKTVNASSSVGVQITADVAIDGTETGYEGKHYLITADEAPSMTLVATAASNVLNVPVRAPYTATLTVTRSVGGVAETPVVTNLTETDAKVCSWSYTYPMYVKKDDVYYIADETSSFGETGTFTDGESINKSVTYTNIDPLVVYFGEPNETAGGNASYSNGNTGYITGGVAYDNNGVIRLGVLPAGSYRLITNVTGNSARYVVVGDCTDTSKFPEALVTITTTGAKDELFTLAAATPISISGKDQGSGKFNQSADVDYILVKKAGVPVTLGTNGYATFASPYALDLTTANLPSDVTAYKASVSGTTVTFTALNQTVPANTGVLLKGTDTVNIPVVATGTAVEGNDFLVNDGGATFAGDASYYYFGLVKNSNPLTFRKFVPSDTAIPADKAYLKVLKSSVDGLARGLEFVFDDEVTGVNEVRSQKEDVRSEWFDLQGRKVAQPQKGLYIVNGKKVVLK